MFPLSILWDPSETMFSLGPVTLRWYAFFWMAGLLAAYFVVMRLYQKQRISEERFAPLFLYCFIGILAGARLGHCLFYEPGYFLAHPIEMLLPIRETATGWKMTGYAGLASHGGTLGLMIALWLYVRKTKLNLFRVLDNIAIATPITAFAIRMGNLMNSEIVGKPTDWEYAFVFVRNGENFGRYPAQLFEALAYLLLFFIMLALYGYFRKTDEPRRTAFLATHPKEDTLLPCDARVGTGFYFGLCLTYIFTFRFFIEMLKEVQEKWELDMIAAIGVNQGQLLSIPFILIGVVCLIGVKRLQEKE